MQLLLHLIPVAVILVILFMRKHMLFAGLCGAVTAMIIGGIAPVEAGNMVMEGIGTMFHADPQEEA